MSNTSSSQVPGFFASIPASVYSPSFYAGIGKRSFWKGFWYLAGVTVLLMLAGSLIAGIMLFKNQDKIETLVRETLNIFPSELVITIQDGKASSNVAEPYSIQLKDLIPEEWADEIESGASYSNQPDNLFVIDTQTPYSKAQFASYDTIIWLTDDMLYVAGDTGGIEEIPLAEAPNIVIDKSFVDTQLATVWSGFVKILPILAVGVFILAFILLMMGRLFYLLILALLTLLLSSIMKVSMDYATAYKTSMYAITLSSILNVGSIFTAYAINLRGIPFMFTIVALIVVAVNLQKAKQLKLIK